MFANSLQTPAEETRDAPALIRYLYTEFVVDMHAKLEKAKPEMTKVARDALIADSKATLFIEWVDGFMQRTSVARLIQDGSSIAVQLSNKVIAMLHRGEEMRTEDTSLPIIGKK